MSIRVFVIQAEGEGVAAALQLIAGLNLNPAPRVDSAPPLLSADNGVRPSVRPYKARARSTRTEGD